MKLTDITLDELNSLFLLTEKYMEYIAKQVRLNQNVNNSKYYEINKKYNNIAQKYNLILNELNKRISLIEE